MVVWNVESDNDLHISTNPISSCNECGYDIDQWLEVLVFLPLCRQVFGAAKCDPQFSGPQRNAGGKIPEEVLAHTEELLDRQAVEAGWMSWNAGR